MKVKDLVTHYGEFDAICFAFNFVREGDEDNPLFSPIFFCKNPRDAREWIKPYMARPFRIKALWELSNGLLVELSKGMLQEHVGKFALFGSNNAAVKLEGLLEWGREKPFVFVRITIDSNIAKNWLEKWGLWSQELKRMHLEL